MDNHRFEVEDAPFDCKYIRLSVHRSTHHHDLEREIEKQKDMMKQKYILNLVQWGARRAQFKNG